MLSVNDAGFEYAIDGATEFYITHVDGGLDTLTFNLPTDDPVYGHIAEENTVGFGDNEYVVKAIDAPGRLAKVACSLNLDFLKAEIRRSFSCESQTLQEMLAGILPGGWTVTGYEPDEIRVISLTDVTDYDIVMKAMDTYGVKYRWSVKNRTVEIVNPDDAAVSGEYLTDELNLRSVAFKGTSADIVTRLYPYGKDGLSIKELRGGLEYIENFDFCDKPVSAVWTDDSYTDPELLLAAASDKLKAMAYPVRSYECDVIDLAKLDERYSMFGFSLYKVVTLIDRQRGVRIHHQVKEYKEYPDEPQKNVVTLSSVVGRLQGTLSQLKTTVSQSQAAVTRSQTAVSEARTTAQQFNNLMLNSLGLYQTSDVLPDGSIVTYFHDTPDREESARIWRRASDGFDISTDGGETWVPGFSNGKAVLNLLSAAGIAAGWIKTGKLEASDGQFCLDLDSGAFRFAGSQLLVVASAGITSSKSDGTARAVMSSGGGFVTEKSVDGVWKVTGGIVDDGNFAANLLTSPDSQSFYGMIEKDAVNDYYALCLKRIIDGNPVSLFRVLPYTDGTVMEYSGKLCIRSKDTSNSVALKSNSAGKLEVNGNAAYTGDVAVTTPTGTKTLTFTEGWLTGVV